MRGVINEFIVSYGENLTGKYFFFIF